MTDFEKIIEKNHRIIYKICRVYSGDDDFDDLYQEMLIAIWKSLKKFKGNSQLSTWIYKVVLNTALTYQKREKRRFFERVELREADGKESDSLPPPDDKIELLYYAIKKLRPEERSFILLYLEEKNYEEIAAIMGISQGNARVKLTRIKKKLQTIIHPNE